tara:strand:- start:4 stop:252 length:249 start_codon:yes stop_codon:yes gene_type:complete
MAASIAPIAPTNPTNEAISITALQLSRVYLYKNCTIYKIKAGFMAHILHFNTKKGNYQNDLSPVKFCFSVFFVDNQLHSSIF